MAYIAERVNETICLKCQIPVFRENNNKKKNIILSYDDSVENVKVYLIFHYKNLCRMPEKHFITNACSGYRAQLSTAFHCDVSQMN